MVNVQLTESLAAALGAKAAAHGLSLEAYLETLIEPKLNPPSRLNAEELERMLDEEATLGTSPKGSFSRAELYCDHD
jgi:hypothetical protein